MHRTTGMVLGALASLLARAAGKDVGGEVPKRRRPNRLVLLADDLG